PGYSLRSPSGAVMARLWGRSSAGRALESHSRGRGFDSPRLHLRFHALGPRAPSNLCLIFAGGVRIGRPLASPLAFDRDDDGGGVRLRVRGDALERGARLRLERQAVAVEYAAGSVPGDGHRLVRRDTG